MIAKPHVVTPFAALPLTGEQMSILFWLLIAAGIIGEFRTAIAPTRKIRIKRDDWL
jgi:hypothetical protein